MTTPKHITIRGLSPELTRRLRALGDARGESMNATVLRVLEGALGVSERRERLLRWATWTMEDAAEIDQVVREQRIVDDDRWK